MPLLTYRTGPFAGSGIPIANGMHDYLRMLNERDGGIGGVKIVDRGMRDRLRHQEGRRVLRAVKGKNPVVVNPYSTGITLQLIPKAAVDKIPSCRWPTASRPRPTATTSRGSSIRRRPTGTALSMIIKYIGEKEGGLDKLKGKKIGFIISTRGYGKEPIPLLEAARQGYGFEREALSGRRAGDAEPVRACGSTSAATVRTGWSCGAGAP